MFVNTVKYCEIREILSCVIDCEIFMMFVNTVKYCEIREILSRQYFLDFTIFHNISHVFQYCTLYCTAPVCRCSDQRNSVYYATDDDSSCLVLRSIHVRGITKWGRRDSVTAHGPRTDCHQ